MKRALQNAHDTFLVVLQSAKQKSFRTNIIMDDVEDFYKLWRLCETVTTLAAFSANCWKLVGKQSATYIAASFLTGRVRKDAVSWFSYEKVELNVLDLVCKRFLRGELDMVKSSKSDDDHLALCICEPISPAFIAALNDALTHFRCSYLRFVLDGLRRIARVEDIVNGFVTALAEDTRHCSFLSPWSLQDIVFAWRVHCYLRTLDEDEFWRCVAATYETTPRPLGLPFVLVLGFFCSVGHRAKRKERMSELYLTSPGFTMTVAVLLCFHLSHLEQTHSDAQWREIDQALVLNARDVRIRSFDDEEDEGEGDHGGLVYFKPNPLVHAVAEMYWRGVLGTFTGCEYLPALFKHTAVVNNYAFALVVCEHTTDPDENSHIVELLHQVIDEGAIALAIKGLGVRALAPDMAEAARCWCRWSVLRRTWLATVCRRARK